MMIVNNNNSIVLSFPKNRKRIDFSISEKLRNCVLNNSNRKNLHEIVINLYGIDFIDSISLSVFAELTELLKSKEVKLHFINLSADLHDLVKFVKAENLFAVYQPENKEPILVA